MLAKCKEVITDKCTGSVCDTNEDGYKDHRAEDAIEHILVFSFCFLCYGFKCLKGPEKYTGENLAAGNELMKVFATYLNFKNTRLSF